jgi:hypothetical protein
LGQPAFLLLWLAMQPNGTTLILLLLIAIVSVMNLYPDLVQQVTRAWYAHDLGKFESMQGRMEEHAKTIHSFISLARQLRDARRFDAHNALTEIRDSEQRIENEQRVTFNVGGLSKSPGSSHDCFVLMMSMCL